MDFTTLLLFVPACFALNMAPGPNNLLALNNAQRYGLAAAIMGGLGRLVAFMIMIALVTSGLAVVLLTSQWLFFTVKIMGAGYLFWLAVKLWRAPSIQDEPLIHQAARSSLQLSKQECLLALGNPKAILIFTAFLPQFIDPTAAVMAQSIALGALFLLLELTVICLYAALGAFSKNWLKQRHIQQYFNRLCATFIASLGIAMLMEEKAR
ncbi:MULTISPECIES: LysE family translocator [Pseudoalteromonas]|uniref:Lysine transporter LysE n=1 Tax=Pseudoalteromonas amylolytica TaxID=1859457 RepID=A0A1S1MU42_9GAMM|nr:MULTISPECIES: LysE family translocator [Pseudoalteromonas]OHU85048.1 lysine transporter LysE [Pseudoalteromonas sp. JW3]OHU90000.1 lysine transporter LysE [Pseudoalteromonas amylolytica]